MDDAQNSTTGQWFVDSRCINCSAAQTIAPGLIEEAHDLSVFIRQPETEEDRNAAWRALLLCPTASVHAPAGLKPPPGLFPQELAPGLFRLGYNARASYGAHAYFVEADGVKAMIDGPRWTSHIEGWIAGRGGLDHILLTHRDDVADAEKYAARFGARVWIHEDDADAAPFATDILRGMDPAAPADGIKVIPVPGHTKGSVVYLVAGTYLFTGDSLAWDFHAQALQAFSAFAWYDWPTQTRSLERLRAEEFSWILAGHGGSINLPPARMKAELESMLSRFHVSA